MRPSSKTLPVSSRAVLFTLVSCLWILVSQTSPAFLDTNHNGISDLWEKTYNNNLLFPGSYNPQADPDGDGRTNLLEAIAGTNPLSSIPPAGYIQATQVHVPAVYLTGSNGVRTLVTPEAYSLSWPTKIGKLYTLSCSTDLMPNSWLAIDVPLTGNGNVMGITTAITQPDGSIPSKLFWRVAVNDTDRDNDGLTDSEENQLSTNPLLADTDGDGRSDFFEASAATNPLINQFSTDSDWPVEPATAANKMKAFWDFNTRDSATKDFISRVSTRVAKPMPYAEADTIWTQASGMVGKAALLGGGTRYLESLTKNI